MTFKSFNLAAAVVNALRALAPDTDQQEQLDAQQAQISSVRAGFDALTAKLDALVASNASIDGDQAEDIAGIKGELEALANALAGPADDPTDNGVIGEVEPIDPDVTSPAADDVVAEQGTAAEQGEDQEQQEEQGE